MLVVVVLLLTIITINFEIALNVIMTYFGKCGLPVIQCTHIAFAELFACI